MMEHRGAPLATEVADDGTSTDGGSGVRAGADASAGLRAVVDESGALAELKDASRWYGNVVAVNGVSFALRAGITGLLGPNGAGKSTLINMISGFLKPSAGSVLVQGAPSWQNPGAYRSLGIVPERDALYGFLSAFEFILLNARLQGVSSPEEATARAIRIVDLQDAQHRKIDTYSKGMRQRAKVAAALVHEPQILLLDEPFNGLDPRQRLQMMNLLRKEAARGRAILFSSHILEEVDRLADRVLVIIAGRLAASGPPREIRALMTDRPHTFTIRSSDDRSLARLLIGDAEVTSMELGPRNLTVRAADYRAFTTRFAAIARAGGITVFEMVPSDESLDSVFSYLVEGKGT